MDFSTQDLEALQRVAGILGVPVDELIVFGRRETTTSSPNEPYSPGYDGSGRRLRETPADEAPDQGRQWCSTLPSRGSHWAHFPQCPSPDSVYSDARQLGDPSAGASKMYTGDQDRQVILLNPHAASYACDAGLLGMDASPTIAPLFPDPIAISDDNLDWDYAPAPPTPGNSDSSHASAVQDREMEDVSTGLGSEWRLVSPKSSPAATGSTATSEVSKSRKRQYARIQPRPGAELGTVSSPSTPCPKRRKKQGRSPYQEPEKYDTLLTRQNNACVRCRMQRNRCIPDRDNPSGPCKPCQEKTVRISRLPCLRYKVTDCTLFRTSLGYMQFYKEHPLVGPHYGDFHLQKQWTPAASKYLCLSQDRGPYLHTAFIQIELREFVPPADDLAVDLKGRSMYVVPWAIADQDSVVRAVNKYIDESIDFYMDGILDDTDRLEWDVFHWAYRASIFPVPNAILKMVLRLWVACRFIEGKWRCWGDDDILASNPISPLSPDKSAPPPPYLDYQLASVVIHRVLVPLRDQVLRELQAMILQHRPKDWFVTFLISFILLHNYELQMQFQLQFAAKRKSEVRYLDMPLVRATNAGAKTILAHFHYCCKGQRPFGKDFDWNAQKIRRMARLDGEQSSFMTNYRDLVIGKEGLLGQINRTDLYHEKYWYTSQLFDPEWIPRETLEHSPAMGEPSTGVGLPAVEAESHGQVGVPL